MPQKSSTAVPRLPLKFRDAYQPNKSIKPSEENGKARMLKALNTYLLFLQTHQRSTHHPTAWPSAWAPQYEISSVPAGRNRANETFEAHLDGWKPDAQLRLGSNTFFLFESYADSLLKKAKRMIVVGKELIIDFRLESMGWMSLSRSTSSIVLQIYSFRSTYRCLASIIAYTVEAPKSPWDALYPSDWEKACASGAKRYYLHVCIKRGCSTWIISR